MIPNGNIPSTSQTTLPQPVKVLPKKIKKAPRVMAMENKNWLIYFHYTRREFGICNILIKEELLKSNGMNEFANYVQGVILRHEGKIQESLEYFQKCHVLNPKSIDNIKQVARSLSLLGRQKLSIDALQEAKNIYRHPDWSIYQNLGLCYYNLGDLEKAKENFGQAVQVNRQESSFSNLAKIHVIEKDIPKAVEMYKAALELSPDNVDLSTSLGLLYMRSGDNQKAFEHFGSALAHHPDCSGALLATGLIMQNHKEHDVALSKYKLASVIIPESAPLWNNIGMCFFGKRKLVAAINCLKRAQYLAPLDWKILYNLGLVHIYSQQYASAFHFLSSALNLQPKIGRVFLPLAITLSQLNDVKNAKTAFEQAVANLPDDPLVLMNYSLFLYKQNEIPKAKEEFRKFQLAAQRVKVVDNNVLHIASLLQQKLSGENLNESESTECTTLDSIENTDPKLLSTSHNKHNQKQVLSIKENITEDCISGKRENSKTEECISQEITKPVSDELAETK